VPKIVAGKNRRTRKQRGKAKKLEKSGARCRERPFRFGQIAAAAIDHANAKGAGLRMGGHVLQALVQAV
jgi:hypothetical protein